MNVVDDFFNKAKKHDLCARGAELWGRCKSKKSLVDLALSSFACDYFCKSIVQGWGLRQEDIAADFEQFNCGRYTRNRDGYTSQMYCLPDTDTIRIASTLTLIIGFNGTIRVPENRAAELYLCNSHVDIVGDGAARIYLYNSGIRDANINLIIKKEEVCDE